MKSHDFEGGCKKFDAIIALIEKGKMATSVLLQHCYDYQPKWNRGM